MRFEKAFVPYGAYWSTPFWGGRAASEPELDFAGDVARRVRHGEDRPHGLAGCRQDGRSAETRSTQARSRR
jgi:hypothetical protein